MYRSMELLDSAIAKSSEKLDGDDNELQQCLMVIFYITNTFLIDQKTWLKHKVLSMSSRVLM